MLAKRLLLPCLLGALPLVCMADERPRWEFGLGLGTLSLPDYRGSDERRPYVLPLPYLVYRGDVLKADREGARMQLLGMERVHLDIYLGASVPVSSQRNSARVGMPSLSGALELGPALDALLYRSADELMSVKLRLPVSYGLTLGSQVGGNGWQSSPLLSVYLSHVGGQQGWNLGLATGPIFGSRQRHAYFYDVAPQYATVNRPEYRAEAGYSGAQFTAALSKRFDRAWVGFFMRYDNLNGATFVDSPLVKTRSYLAGGVGFAWMLGQSSEMVKVD